MINSPGDKNTDSAIIWDARFDNRGVESIKSWRAYASKSSVTITVVR